MTLTKTLFRQKCLEKFKKLPKHSKMYNDKLLAKKLYKELRGVKNKSIMFYYPIQFEANILKVLNTMRRKNDVFIPFMEGQSFKLVTYRLPLEKKKFGIFEAGNSSKNIKKIDIAIVPALGVDKNFQRIGFGKGMYDRFFAKLQKKPYTIFVQPDLCYLNEEICDDYDVSCDMLLTPRKKLIARRKK